MSRRSDRPLGPPMAAGGRPVVRGPAHRAALASAGTPLAGRPQPAAIPGHPKAEAHLPPLRAAGAHEAPPPFRQGAAPPHAATGVRSRGTGPVTVAVADNAPTEARPDDGHASARSAICATIPAGVAYFSATACVSPGRAATGVPRASAAARIARARKAAVTGLVRCGRCSDIGFSTSVDHVARRRPASHGSGKRGAAATGRTRCVRSA